MRLAYLEKGSTVTVLTCALRPIQQLGFLSGGSALVGIGYGQLYRLWELTSPLTPCSSQYPFCVWRKCHDSQPEYIQLPVSPFLIEVFSPIKSFEKCVLRFCALLWIEFFFVLEFNQFFEDSCLNWGVILRLSRIFRCREPECVVLLLGFFRSEKFIYVGSKFRITLWNHTNDCHIYWFNVFELLQSNPGEL